MAGPERALPGESKGPEFVAPLAVVGVLVLCGAIAAFGPAKICLIDRDPGDRVWIRGHPTSEGEVRVWPPGDVLIYVEKDGFEPMHIRIRARPWRSEVVTWPLVHEKGTLILRSNPPGARFLVDTDVVTPPPDGRISCNTGRILVEATWPSGETASIEVELARDQTMELSADLATRKITSR